MKHSDDYLCQKMKKLQESEMIMDLMWQKSFYRDVNVSYFLGFPIFSMLVLTHLF